jgi:hypothetical protein
MNNQLLIIDFIVTFLCHDKKVTMLYECSKITESRFGGMSSAKPNEQVTIDLDFFGYFFVSRQKSNKVL